MVWPRFKVFWFSSDNPIGHTERNKKKRQTEEEVGKQYEKVDMNRIANSAGVAVNRQDGKGLLRIYLWCPDDHPML